MIIQIGLIFLFLIISLFIFTFPGLLILRRLNTKFVDSIDEYVCGSTLGFVLFTLAGYLLAFLHLRFLMWGIPIVGLISFGILFKSLNLKLNLSRKMFLVFLAVMIIGLIGQVAVNFPSGQFYKDGIYFWSSHGHDGIWHVALMEEMKKNIFPFQNPEFSGHKLQNYHFFVDLFMSEVSRLFGFSSFDVYFRLVTTFFSLLLGLSSFVFVREWTKNTAAALWAIFFMYFCGSFGFILTLIQNHVLGGETVFWVSQPQSTIGNPPHAAAFIILSVILYFLLKYINGEKRSYLILIILGGTIIEFKVYAGLLVLGGLAVISIWQILRERKFSFLLLFIPTLLFSLILYLPNNVNSQDFLLWQPWYYIRTMVVASDRLNWLEMEHRRQTYVSEHNYKRVLQLELTAFLIFLFGNLGMRFIGFLTVFRSLKNKFISNYFDIFLFSVIFASFIIPVLFLQKGVAWNSIQFMQYTLLLFGFLGASGAAYLTSKLPKALVPTVILAIIIFAVPTQIGLLLQFYTNLPLSKISYDEIDVLKALKAQSDENVVVLTGYYDQYVRDHYTPPIPIYSWYDTGYVSAISGRRTFLTDQEQINITGYKAEELFEQKKKIFETKSAGEVNDYLKKNKIDYVYLVYGQTFKAELRDLNLKPILKKGEATLFKVI